ITTFDSCLIAYPFEEWRILEERIAGLPEFKKETRAFLRFFYSSAADCPIDKLGRVTIPQTLRGYARLEKEVMLVGAFKQFEIWGKDIWSEAEGKVSPEDIGGMLERLGL
ncbi:MAG: division/cell wall cluster transcriptional repressor MraZ, partial [Deltaproteobacteria bacterium]|nr:division/cell wall cluster transcriptional repressor MraZ [Deltaproteobacteria bacterium]